MLLQVLLLPLWDMRQLSQAALVTAILFILVSGFQLMKNVRALYFALLGYGVMAFLDIWKHNFFFNPHYLSTEGHVWAANWTFISCLIFLLAYKFKSFRVRIPRIQISYTKLKFIAIPISLALLTIYLVYVEITESHTTFHSVLVLLGFVPKACAVICFYLFIRDRKKEYFFWFLLLLIMSFTEGTRRVYITLFTICLAVFYAHILSKWGKIAGGYKVVALISFLGIFFYMNYLRADMEMAEGYQEGKELSNTFNYMIRLTALDTYDNTAFLLENFPERFRYYYGETYVAFFVQFIPRIYWAAKPVGLGGPLALLKYTGNREFTKEVWIRDARGISYSPGFIGEAYANFGKVGIILMSVLFGLGTKWFDTNVDERSVLDNPVQMANTAWYGSFFLLLRGDLVMALYYSMLFYIFLLIWFIILRRS